jgi:uncharacterized DUF497 family protein
MNSNYSFEWDQEKEKRNIIKHGVDFSTAAAAFFDDSRMVFIDAKNSSSEQRFFCVAEIESKIITVRFTYRSDKIRIIGAGFWRKGAKYYEKEKNRP